MEEHRSPAHAAPEAEQPLQQQVAAAAAAENGNGPAENGDGSPLAAPSVVPVAAGDGRGADEGGDGSLEAADTALLGGPRRTGLHLFVVNIRSVFKLDEVGAEVLGIAVPAALALTADPLASLIDTAVIGRLGSVEIAAVGVAIAVFNQVMKVCIYPLVSVTTSFVAEEDAILSKGGGAKVADDGEENEAGQAPERTAACTDPEKQQPAAEEAAQRLKRPPTRTVPAMSSPRARGA